MKNQDELSAQVAAIITAGEKVLTTEAVDAKQKAYVNETKFHDFRISALSFLSRVFGESSIFYSGFKSEVTHPTSSRTRRGLGILESAKKELAGNWLDTTWGTISRDMLTDILRIARLNLEQGNVAAAAAVAGAIVEKQLRNLCQTKDIPLHNEVQGKAVPKRALQLTGEAYKKKLYTRQDNKDIMSWLELASLEPAKLDSKQVAAMLNGLNAFIAKTRY